MWQRTLPRCNPDRPLEWEAGSRLTRARVCTFAIASPAMEQRARVTQCGLYRALPDSTTGTFCGS
jgi:hypothetical protein